MAHDSSTFLPPLDAPAPQDERDSYLLKSEIDALLPTLWKTDTSPQLTGILRLISRARLMGPPGVAQLEALAQRLRNMRAFDDLYTLTSEMSANGMATDKTRRLEVQALIELRVYETALDLVRPLLSGPVAEHRVQEAYGHLGRIYKQMYVDGRAGRTPEEPATLQLYAERAFNAYMTMWDALKTHWHGVNALAIACMAHRHGLTEADPQAEQLAREILNAVSKPSDDENWHWSLASKGEAHVALGEAERGRNQAEKAEEHYARAAAAYHEFASHPKISPFDINASLRQLLEIWEISGEDPVRGKPVRLLKAALIAKSRQVGQALQAANAPSADMPALDVAFSRREMELAEQELSADLRPPATAASAGAIAQNLQKAFGEAFPLAGKALANLFRSASAVCRIHSMRDGQMKGIASGFAIRGDVLHESFGPGPVIVTNNHVISSRGAYGARRFDLCRAAFVGGDMATENMVEFDSVLWESDVEAHDITVLKPKGDLPPGATPLATVMPARLADRPRSEGGIGRCYVVGFPNAGEIAFSLSDNILLDHDAPPHEVECDPSGRIVCKGATARPVRIHYRTPTLVGNSGSPVFDADHVALLGVHRAGAPDMPRLPPPLPGASPTYAANEGVWIESIRQAIAESVAAHAAGAEASIAGSGVWFGIPTAAFSAERAAAAPSTDLVDAPLPAAARRDDEGGVHEIPGWPGDPAPGVSPVAEEILYRPGPAREEDVKAAQLESLIGTDNRTRIFDTGMTPWRMICAIRAHWGSATMVGTGCFIGPRTVLTAGHVVLPRKPGTRPEAVEVIPGLSGEKRPYASFRASRLTVHPNWNGPFLPRFDIAVIHLDEDVGRRVGWFGLAARPREVLVGHWAHITGYPGEMKEAVPGGRVPLQACQLWHHAAPVERIEHERLFYKADTTEGQSGAPIYVLADAQKVATPLVVGVHAYGARSTPGAVGAANSGAWIDAAMLKTLMAWRAP